MITGELKSKVDRVWEALWSGGISNPLSVIEQLTYLLFIKRLDELHTLQERKAARTGDPIERPLFTARQNALRWSRFKELAPEQMFETVRDRVFPFIKSMGQTGDADEGSTYTDHMKDALFMMPTPRVLANVVDQLDDIDMADRDTKGDLYEYMLGKIATAGQNGQFRTPRHIIKLMVEMTAPTPKDVICDGCGSSSSTPNRCLWASGKPLGAASGERRSEEVSDPSKAWWREVARRGTDRAERQYYPISTSLGVRTRRCSALRGSAPTHQDRDWLVAGASEPPRLQPDASVPWATPSDHGLRRCHRRRSDTCGACPGVGQLDDDVHYHAVTSTSYTAAVARSSGVWAPPMRASGAQAALSHRSSSPGGLQARVPASAQ